MWSVVGKLSQIIKCLLVGGYVLPDCVCLYICPIHNFCKVCLGEFLCLKYLLSTCAILRMGITYT